MKPAPVRNPPNPWSSQQVEYLGEPPETGLEIYEDHSRSILAENRSPDLGFRWSVNPYRGCLHACAYCYARPTHQRLGYGAGTDHDRRILVKPRAPELLREAFESRRWEGELILFSGNTDCYQPLEASYELTRRLLQVCAEYRNPIHIITKAALIERDLDVLGELAQTARCSVSVSVPFWDPEHCRAIEPLAPAPRRRIETIRRLADAGLHVTVNVAPLIPGLTDRDMPAILEAAAEAGASSAALILLRLPGEVREVFLDRLRAALPLHADRVIARTREVRGGKLNESQFGKRMRGEGQYCSAIWTLFEATAKRVGLMDRGDGKLGGDPAEPAPSTFRRPTDRGGQLRLFG